MCPLHDPGVGAAAAAAREIDLPADFVFGGECRHAPARNRGDRLCGIACRAFHQPPAPQHEGGDTAGLRRELQAAARGEVKLLDLAQDRAEALRLQAFFHRPEGFVVALGGDQDQALRVELLLMEAMRVEIDGWQAGCCSPLLASRRAVSELYSHIGELMCPMS